jgi:hypothetical protein
MVERLVLLSVHTENPLVAACLAYSSKLKMEAVSKFL